MIVDPQALSDACDRHIQSLHSIMWGASFQVTKPDDRKKAVDWISKEIERILVLLDDDTSGTLDQHRPGLG